MGLTANKNYKDYWNKLKYLSLKLYPYQITILKNFKNINKYNVEVLNGESSYDEILDYDTDLVIAAITGAIGLMPSFQP